MPTLPPELGECLKLLVQPALILAGVGLYLNLLNKQIDDRNKRIDNLREDQKEMRKDMKDGLGKLDAKLDRLLEGRFSKLS